MDNVFIIVMDVENNQNSYYKYIKIFEACVNEKYKKLFTTRMQDKVYGHYMEDFLLEQKQYFQYIANTIEELYERGSLHYLTSHQKLNSNVKKIILYFRIWLDETSDVTDLIYYFLIKQYIEARNKHRKIPIYCQLIIAHSGTEDMRFKISLFLIFESKKGTPVFLKSGNRQFGYAVNLPGTVQNSNYEIKSLEKFYPLLEIRQDVYEFLSDSVIKAFGSENKTVKKFPERKNLSYLDSQMTQKEILIDMCYNYYTKGHSTAETKLRKQFFESEDFFNTVRNMNLLSFLLLCSFEFYLHKSSEMERREPIELSIGNLQEQINVFNNLSSGLLQIIENVVAHTENQNGYFTFRIHNSQSVYMKTKYASYLNKLNAMNIQNICNMFLEIKVYDLNLINKGNTSTMSDKFLEKLRSNWLKEPEMHQLFDKFQGISVKDFFLWGNDNKEYGDAWREYYSRQKNWLYHYGLKLYARIVNRVHGYFEVNSQNGLLHKHDIQHYSTVPTRGEEIDYFPGTQYNVIFPYLMDVSTQEHIGVDSDIRYDEMLQKMLHSEIHIDEQKMLHLFRKITDKYEEPTGANYGRLQTIKEEFVEEVYNTIKNLYCSSSENIKEPYVIPVLILDMKGIRSTFWQEIMAKAIWSYICNDNSVKKFYCAIIDTPFETIQYLTNIIAVYFSLNPSINIYKDIQLYICNKDNEEDFLISGTNLAEIRSRAYKYAASKGIFPNVLTHLFFNLDDTTDKFETSNNQPDIIPFDILVKNNGESRFIYLTKQVMKKEIYGYEYGCKLPSTHIRLGSKIHIHNFFEAEILFQDCYFSKRMAYLVVEDILNRKRNIENPPKKLVLVGYENYSEMFIYDIHKYLEKEFARRKLPFILGNYTICMDVNGKLDFRGMEDFNSEDDVEFIIVVSINSTLTTHSKIKAALERRLPHLANIKIFVNYAVILLRDNYVEKFFPKCEKPNMTELECTFWENIDTKLNLVKSRYMDEEIKYFISEIADWEDPLHCPMCFPSEIVQEKVLINTNKTSTIPSLQYGLVSKKSNLAWTNSDLDLLQGNDEFNKKIEQLARNVKYGHIKRNDNHFLYYFDTRKLFEDSKDDIQEWLKGIVRDQVRRADNNGNNYFGIYNILVTPVHESNTGFIELINDSVFDNTAYIMRFEINRIYRDNMMARYSNLTLLYRRLIETANKIGGIAQINLYYADDTVVSGRTYERANSMVHSLFRNVRQELGEKSKRVETNIFKGCFFMLNRLSSASINGMFGENCDNYSYFDVPISSIRNHEDFCFMCNLIKDAHHLGAKSSTNGIAQRWKKVEKRFQLREYYKYEDRAGREQRYQNRFYSAYWFNLVFKRMGGDAEDSSKVCKMIVEQILAKQMRIYPKIDNMTDNERLEILFSYVKVLSRPFSNYQWRTREAVFYLILIFLEVLLDKEISNQADIMKVIEKSGYKYIGNKKPLLRICSLIKKRRMIREKDTIEDIAVTYSMLVIFIKQAMELNSNYIIRKKNIIRIHEKYQEIVNGLNKLLEQKPELERNNEWKDEIENIKNFESIYIRYVKQLISLSGDEKKCVWLEELLLTGNETSLQKNGVDEEFLRHYGIQSKLGKELYIENTQAIQEALERLITEVYEESVIDEQAVNLEEKLRKIFSGNNRYYLNSFLDILHLNGFKGISNKQVADQNDSLLMIQNMIELKHRLDQHKYDEDLEEFYFGIMCKFAAILDCRTAECNIVTETGNSVNCLLKIVQNDAKKYTLKQGGEASFIRADELKNLDVILRTFGFFEKSGKQYLVIRFESDTDGMGREQDNEFQSQLIMRPLFFTFDVTDKKQEDVIKRLRFILSMRASIVENIEQDFKNNSFQEMLEEKNKKLLLSNWKNATHADDWIYSAVIRQMREYHELSGSLSLFQKDDYIQRLEGIALRLLSDSNISSNYHSSLTGAIDKKYAIDNEGSYVVTMELGESLFVKYINSLQVMPQEEKDNVVCDGIEIENILGKRLIYFNGEQERTMLILIPILQNAMKHCRYKGKVKIYSEIGIQFIPDGERVDYLCIENSLANPQYGIESQMRNYMENPVGRREPSHLDSQNGISLFSVNQFVKKILEKVYKQKIEFTEPPLKVFQDIEAEKMIVKIPILTTKKEL